MRGGDCRVMTYCWRTQKCRNLCVPHAFFEGKKAGETFPRKSTPRTLKGEWSHTTFGCLRKKEATGGCSAGRTSRLTRLHIRVAKAPVCNKRPPADCPELHLHPQASDTGLLAPAHGCRRNTIVQLDLTI